MIRGFVLWSDPRDSNPPHQLGRLRHILYTMIALSWWTWPVLNSGIAFTKGFSCPGSRALSTAHQPAHSRPLKLVAAPEMIQALDFMSKISTSAVLHLSAKAGFPLAHHHCALLPLKLAPMPDSKPAVDSRHPQAHSEPLKRAATMSSRDRSPARWGTSFRAAGCASDCTLE